MKRINRPTIFGVVCLFALLASSLAACQPAATQAPLPTAAPVQATQAVAAPSPVVEATQAPAPTAVPTPVPPTQAPVNKDLVFVIPEDPPSFNAMVSDTGYDALVSNLVLLGLTGVDQDGKIYPELASELPSQENGNVVLDEEAGTMVVTWKMRTDVQWQDGTPVTADDVIFTWEAIKDPDKGLWIPGSDYIDSVDKVDDHTLTITYNTIYPGYLTQFGGEKIVIWPAHYCDAAQGYSAWDCGRTPLSDGPFMLEDWVAGDHLTFARNPNYFDAPKPDVERITVRIVPDASVRKEMMAQGDADVNMWVTEPVANDLKDVSGVSVAVSPYGRWVMRLFFNLAAKGKTDAAKYPHPILSDVRVRQAIRHAIDVDTISKEIFLGYSQPIWTEFFRPPYTCDVPRPAYDPAEAARLLEEAGWKDTNGDGIRECEGCTTAKKGYPMKMELITYSDYGEPLELSQQLIGEMLGKVGIKVDLTVVEGNVLWADYASDGIEQRGNFDIDLWDDGYAGTDPTDFLYELYAAESAEPDNGWNIGRWINEDFQNLLSEAYTLDEAKRQEIFCQMAQILDQDAPNFLMFTTINADAYSNRIEGVKSTINDVVTWNVADWVIK